MTDHIKVADAFVRKILSIQLIFIKYFLHISLVFRSYQQLFYMVIIYN